jgi:hypothetical protein
MTYHQATQGLARKAAPELPVPGILLTTKGFDWAEPFPTASSGVPRNGIQRQCAADTDARPVSCDVPHCAADAAIPTL